MVRAFRANYPTSLYAFASVALAENLWSTIKVELIYWAAITFTTRAEAHAALFRYIERVVKPPPHPSRPRWNLTRRVRSCLARQTGSPPSGYPSPQGCRFQIEKSS
jgi:hypothetical protein